jgi:hypothetical protein
MCGEYMEQVALPAPLPRYQVLTVSSALLATHATTNTIHQMMGHLPATFQRNSLTKNCETDVGSTRAGVPTRFKANVPLANLFFRNKETCPSWCWRRTVGIKDRLFVDSDGLLLARLIFGGRCAIKHEIRRGDICRSVLGLDTPVLHADDVLSNSADESDIVGLPRYTLSQGMLGDVANTHDE